MEAGLCSAEALEVDLVLVRRARCCGRAQSKSGFNADAGRRGERKADAPDACMHASLWLQCCGKGVSRRDECTQ